ncbi:MAG: chemotaxis protein CheW [Wolinella sp.]
MSELFKRVEHRSKTHLNNIMQLAVFTLNDDRYYGINVSKILSFEDMYRYKLLRSSENQASNAYLLGFIEYQGRAIPVLSLQKWLGLAPSDCRVVLICEYNRENLALPIEAIENIYNVPIRALQKPDIPFGEAFTYSAILTLNGRDESVLVLDIERLLDECGLQSKNDGEYSPLNPSKTIYVAEDSLTARAILGDFFEQLGVSVKFFSDGQALLEAIMQLDHDEVGTLGAVLTDLEMPHVDGYQVILRLREEHVFDAIPIWVYSSMSNQGVHDKIKQIGAQGLIAKGDYATLYAMLHRCL